MKKILSTTIGILIALSIHSQTTSNYVWRMMDGSEEKVRIDATGTTFFTGGNFGIGTATPAYTLDVFGIIRAEEVIVDLLGGPDFVFESTYQLRSLEEVEQFILKNKRLPEIQSAKEMEKNGVDIADLNSKLLLKIEELTLYVIEINKKNKELEAKIDVLMKR